MSQDYYEILQVHPRAEQDTIKAAYERMLALYDPAKLEGAASELIELARDKRNLIEQAYAVLSDPVRRANYDAELARTSAPDTTHTTDEEDEPAPAKKPHEPLVVLDYRPLPPANRKERPKDFDPYPKRTLNRRRIDVTGPSNRKWIAPVSLLLVAVLVFGIGFAITQGDVPTANLSSSNSPLDVFEAEVEQARQIAEANPTVAAAWVQYGNMLYNSVAIVRENQPGSMLYIERLPRWLEAAQAYSRALELEPNNASVRSDLGASSCFYGSGINDQSYVQAGIAEARRALNEIPNDARAMLNMGQCLISTQPPQRAEALELWQRVIETTPADSPLAIQAQRLITLYQQ